jgi:hypothetical protein
MGAASGGDKGDLHRKRLPLRLLVAESGDDADRETITAAEPTPGSAAVRVPGTWIAPLTNRDSFA